MIIIVEMNRMGIPVWIVLTATRSSLGNSSEALPAKLQGIFSRKTVGFIRSFGNDNRWIRWMDNAIKKVPAYSSYGNCCRIYSAGHPLAMLHR